MPVQVDSNGAIVDTLPPAGSSDAIDTGLSPDVVTIRTGIDWGFWGLAALGAWWVYNELSGRSSKKRIRRRVRHDRARR
jgi:hypothetical protein